MTEKEKDLLIKDLCGRSPYGVKFRYKYIDNFFHEAYGTSTLTGVHPPYRIEHSTLTGNEYLQIERDEIKPYLFPLSSMTEEQKEELITITDGKFRYMCGDITNAIPRKNTSEWGISENAYINSITVINILYIWLLKNHFDINGLIPMGLANDATGLNIY